MDLKTRCSAAGCECKCFVGTKERLRICDSCSHSWLTHLLERLVRNEETMSIIDVCSLALYGTEAIPIRLKILIERLLSTLPPDEIDKILKSFGWTPMDLARGYMIQNVDGLPLSRWSILPREEEPLILEQFHRFRATHSLTVALLKKDVTGGWGDEGDEEGRSQSPAEEMDNLVLNLSSVGPPSSMTSESADESEDDEGLTAVDLSSKSNRSRDSRSMTRSGQQENDLNRKSSLSPPSVRLKTSWSLPVTPVVSTLPNGKRRVECSVCLKTFCDKGALKIHFSAVHLREMHQCTVSGCSMMFSSRRSRNRHSANPNPKLHSPHTRRKISPHDGRTSQPLITFPPGSCYPPFGIIDDPDPDTTEMSGSESKGGREDASPRPSLSPPSVVSADEVMIFRGGARKRKLANPMRVSSSPEKSTADHYSNDLFRRQPQGHKFNLPLSPSRSESNPSSPTEGPNPLQCLATKVFNFNNHFQNLHLNGLPEHWSESVFTPRPRLDFLFDTKPIVPPLFDEDGQRASV